MQSTTMAGKVESINISKASTTTNMFYLFFHGGKAAIIPFLTLFFRLVGLNALEAGTIIAVKTLTSLVWAPLWARYATAYSRHRLVLVISLFMMIMTYLAFPALYTQLSVPEHCFQASSSNHSTDLPLYPSSHDFSTVLTPVSKAQDTYPTTQMPAVTIGTSSSSPSTDSDHNLQQTSTLTTQESALEKATTPPWTSSETSLTDTSAVSLTKNVKPYLYDRLLGILHNQHISIEDFAHANLTLQQLFNFVSSTSAGMTLTDDLVLELYKYLELIAKNTHRETERSVGDHAINKRDDYSINRRDDHSINRRDDHSINRRDDHSINRRDDHSINRRDWIGMFTDKLHSIRTSLQEDRLLLFLIILAVTVGGEIFACPAEKIADDSWFDFLNRIDDLERYGQQRFWGSISFVVIPLIITVAVDYTPCFLFYRVHHFLLHFYIFAVLAGAAMIVAFCYPVPPPANGKYASKITKGLRIICCDGRGFLFSVTLLLTGMVYASHHNFLFWRIQDLGGGETPMGLCVSISAFAEIPMLILSARLVKKLGQSWMVCVCILTLSLRVLCYAFISQPWAFLPIELTHGITHTALWFAILSYDDFNVGAAIDRSIRSILSSFYFGVGFSAGSIVSGYIYHSFGSSVLFWGCSAVAAGWCLLFSVIQKCLPKKEKVRYIKLLRSDSDNSDDEEDDWLEMALKNN